MTAILERALDLCGEIQSFHLSPHAEFDGTYPGAQLLREHATELRAITLSINYGQYQATLADCDLDFDASDYNAMGIALSCIKSAASLLQCAAADHGDDPASWKFPSTAPQPAAHQLSRQSAPPDTPSSTTSASSRSSKSGDTRKYNIVAKLLFGLAKLHYQISFESAAKPRIPKLITDLETIGIRVDDETLRKHLLAGSELTSKSD